MFSPLEQFEILPILQIPFIFTNASLILVIGLVYLFIYLFIQTKFINKSFIKKTHPIVKEVIEQQEKFQTGQLY